MAEHRFDPIAFVFGGLALAAGTIVLTGGELTSEGRVLLPLGLITLGIAVLLSVLRRDPRVAAVLDPAAEPPDDHGRSDLDDLFAPVDDLLAHWPPDTAPNLAGADTGDHTAAHAGADSSDGIVPATAAAGDTDADDTIADDTDTDDTLADDTLADDTLADDTDTDDTRPGGGAH